MVVEAAAEGVDTSPDETAKDGYAVFRGKMQRITDLSSWDISSRTNIRKTLYHDESGPIGFLYLDCFVVDDFEPHDALNYEIEVLPVRSVDGYCQSIDSDNLAFHGVLPNLGTIGFASQHLGIDRIKCEGMRCYIQRNSQTDGPLSALVLDDLYADGIAYRIKVTPTNLEKT